METSGDSNNGFYRNNSGGRVRSLHLTSAENPFISQQPATGHKAAQQRPEQLSDLEILLLEVRELQC